MRPTWSHFSIAWGYPMKMASIDRTDDANAYLAKLDWQVNESNLVTGRWAYHYSEQINGTFDVNSWGRERQRHRGPTTHTASPLRCYRRSRATCSTSFVVSTPRSGDRDPMRGQISPETGRPFPDTAFDFGGWLSGRHARSLFQVEYERRSDPGSSTTSPGSRVRHSIKGGIEYNDVTSSQTFVGFANGRYIFDSFDGFQNYVINDGNYLNCADGSSSSDNGGQLSVMASIATGPVCSSICSSGGCGWPYRRIEAGTQGHRAKRAGALRPGLLASRLPT